MATGKRLLKPQEPLNNCLFLSLFIVKLTKEAFDGRQIKRISESQDKNRI